MILVGRHLLCLSLLIASFAASAVPTAPLRRGTPVFAADAASSPGEISHRSWTRRTGAPFFITALAQDKTGYLWIGSAEGLFRFDGQSFEAIPPPPHHPRTARFVSALASSPDGSIWVGYGSHGGVARFRDGHLIDMHLPDPPTEITEIAIDADGAPWLAEGGSTFGLRRLVKGRWQPVFAPGGTNFQLVFELARSASRGWWILADAGIFLARRGAGRVETAIAGFRASTIALSPTKQAWALGRRGMWRLPDYDLGETGLPKLIRHDVPDYKWLRTTFDRSGELWGVTVTNGVFHIRPGQTGFTRFTEADGLSSDRASAILVDRDDNIWVGTESGLDLFSRQPLQAVDALPRNPAFAYTLTVDGSGATYLSSDRDVWRALPGKPLAHWLSVPNPVMGLCSGGTDEIWALQYDAMLRLRDGHVVERLPLPKPFGEEASCAVDGSGGIWATSDTFGLAERRGGHWFSHGLPDDLGLPNNVTVDSEGRPVVILERRNLARIEGSRIRIWRGDRIGFERPTAFSQGRGDLLIGGGTGLLRIRGNRVEKLDFDDHPWLAEVRGITQARDGSTWLINNRGVIRIRGADLEAAFQHPHRPIAHEMFGGDDPSVGMPQRAPGLQAATGGDGRLWFLTRKQVTQAWPSPEAPRRSFPVTIHAATIAGVRRTDLDHLRLPSGTQSISFDYGAVDLTGAAQRMFRYRLDGLDKDWTMVGERRQVDFFNLSPGNYRLIVQTNDDRGLWIERGASVDFSIAPAFWQTWWFLLLIVSGTVALLGLLIGWRLRIATDNTRRRVEERLAERERIARELHDTLLQGFQGLTLRFQAVVEMLAPGSRPRLALEGALERVDDVLLEGRDRVRALREETEPVDLRARLEAIASAIIPAETTRLVMEEEGSSRRVCAPVAEEIDGIAREAITNAVRHAQARLITIRIRHGRERLVVTIVDDGIGLPEAVRVSGQKDGHYGLVGMRERARRLGATIAFGRGSGSGTEIRLTLPARIAYR